MEKSKYKAINIIIVVAVTLVYLHNYAVPVFIRCIGAEAKGIVVFKGLSSKSSNPHYRILDPSSTVYCKYKYSINNSEYEGKAYIDEDRKLDIGDYVTVKHLHLFPGISTIERE